MIEPVRHDWPKIIREIIAAYGIRYKKRLTPYKLGLMIHDADGRATDKKTIRRWLKSASRPDDFRAQMLLETHAMFHREIGDSVPKKVCKGLEKTA